MFICNTTLLPLYQAVDFLNSFANHIWHIKTSLRHRENVPYRMYSDKAELYSYFHWWEEDGLVGQYVSQLASSCERWVPYIDIICQSITNHSCYLCFSHCYEIGKTLMGKGRHFHPPIRISRYNNLIAVDVLFAHVAKETPVSIKADQTTPTQFWWRRLAELFRFWSNLSCSSDHEYVEKSFRFESKFSGAFKHGQCIRQVRWIANQEMWSVV